MAFAGLWTKVVPLAPLRRARFRLMRRPAGGNRRLATAQSMFAAILDNPVFKTASRFRQLIRSVIRSVIAIRPIVGVCRIGGRVINGRRRRIVGVRRWIVCVGHWIRIAAIPTSSPPSLLDGGL